ncbi:MAG: tetratricopeptide repeat protein [Firmicutes bacterium]|jgi:tetratricopeptide (TPR) repeat protein|nr:tetratricopeptide repeat protein [Bacillota bacterium]
MTRKNMFILALIILLGFTLIACSNELALNIRYGIQALYYHLIGFEEPLPGFFALDAARAEFRQAISRNPDDIEPLVLMGMSYRITGDYHTAISYFLSALEVKPEEEWIYALIGECYLYLDEVDKASDAYYKAIETEEQARALYGLGVISFNKEGYSETIDYMTKALEIAPDLYDARIYLGKSLFFIDDLDKALEELDLAYRINSQKGEVQYYLGKIYEQKGESEKAKHFFERAMELED